MNKKKIKIIRVIARLNVGGPAIHVILLTAGINPERFETQLLSGREAPEEGDMLALAKAKGVTPDRIPNLGRELSPFRDLHTLWNLYRRFKREKPDIVHTHTAKAGTVGRLAAWLAGVPIIIHTFHGHVLHGYFGSWKTNCFRWIEKSLARRTHQIITVSESCRQDLLKYGIGTPDKIKTIPLGLELERFRFPDPNAREQIRKTWNIPPQAFVVGMIARMVPIKRHEDLFRTVPLVLQEYPDTYFLMVGDGELRAELEALAQELRISHRCIFTGFRDDLVNIYSAVDLVVLTSANEGLPVTIIEALSSGVPVVATRVGGAPELVEEGKTGFIVEPGDIASIACGLKQALSNPQRTAQMGKAAQEETIRKYAISRLLRDIEALYAEWVEKT